MSLQWERTAIEPLLLFAVASASERRTARAVASESLPAKQCVCERVFKLTELTDLASLFNALSSTRVQEVTINSRDALCFDSMSEFGTQTTSARVRTNTIETRTLVGIGSCIALCLVASIRSRC